MTHHAADTPPTWRGCRSRAPGVDYLSDSIKDESFRNRVAPGSAASRFSPTLFRRYLRWCGTRFASNKRLLHEGFKPPGVQGWPVMQPQCDPTPPRTTRSWRALGSIPFRMGQAVGERHGVRVQANHPRTWSDTESSAATARDDGYRPQQWRDTQTLRVDLVLTWVVAGCIAAHGTGEGQGGNNSPTSNERTTPRRCGRESCLCWLRRTGSWGTPAQLHGRSRRRPHPHRGTRRPLRP